MPHFVSDGLSGIVTGKWLLWDTSAIIRIVDYEADSVFADLEGLGVTENVTIKPVMLELSATGDQKIAIKRAAIIDAYMSSIINLNLGTTNDRTLNVQESLRASASPGAIDLMLGSTLAQYSKDKKMLLITENIKDFPEPLYQKEGFIMVSNTGRSFGLTILSMDLSKLV